MKSSNKLWLELEAERLDLSYKQRPTKHEPTRADLTRSEQQMFFDAGRYAAGARDSRARAANRKAIEFAGQNGA